MTFDPGAVPAPQSAVLAADSDSPVGVVTSVAPRPGDDGRIYALGFLKTAHSRPETTIRVAVADSKIAGRVEAPS
jgi:glycine cleavage system aminomethyltransferase T